MADNALAGIVKGRGFDDFQRMREEDDAKNPRRGGFRFRLAKGGSANIVFISDQPDLVTSEHTVKIGKRWRNIVCLGDSCPLCAAGERASLVSYFSIMLLTATPKVDQPRYPNPENLGDKDWEADWDVKNSVRRNKGEGALVLNPIQILPAKKATAEILRKQFEKRNGLQGALFEVSRDSSDTSPAVGNVFDFEKKFTSDQVNILNPEAGLVNYEEALEVLSMAQLNALMNHNSDNAASPVPSTSSDTGASDTRRLSW